jgi:hypothetical protein
MSLDVDGVGKGADLDGADGAASHADTATSGGIYAVLDALNSVNYGVLFAIPGGIFEILFGLRLMLKGENLKLMNGQRVSGGLSTAAPRGEGYDSVLQKPLAVVAE